MAKYEKHLRGDFNELLSLLNTGIISGSVTAFIEGSSDYRLGDVRCAVRVYERYSAIGGSRVSLNITLVGSGDDLFVSAISSGGSQAMFFKINTLGEESFLQTATEIVERYGHSR